MTNSENSEPKKRGRPFEKGQSGNPTGRPRGARNASTHMAEALMADAAEAIVQTFIDKALEGNMPALILAMKRILPPSRPQPLQFALLPLKSAADAPAAISSIVTGLAEGELNPTEANALIGAVDAYLKTQAQLEYDRRLAVLEGKIAEIQAQNEMRKSASGESTP